MEVVKIEVECSKEAHELGLAISKLLKESKEATKDGFQPLTDVPAILMASLNDIIRGVSGIDKLDDEARADVQKFANAVYLGLSEGIFALLKKNEPAA